MICCFLNFRNCFEFFMHSFFNQFRFICLFLLPIAVFLCTSCSGKEKKHTCDFPQIVQSDTLRVLTLNTSTSYFIYRDEPMGYHYDMILDFCRRHRLTPQIVLAQNAGKLFEMLKNGEGDVIAYSMPIENALKDSLIYCGLSGISHQVLVQRATARDTLLTDVTELIGKEVSVIKGSKYEQRMYNLNRELGGGIALKYADTDTVVVEDLIRMVSGGEIAYTVADEYLAKLNQTYFHTINVNLPVSFDQRSSWAVRKDTPILADSLNSWFKSVNRQPNYQRIAKRYFEETKGYVTADDPAFVSILKPGQISPYDVHFKKYGAQFGLDWRLLASVAYHESTFNTDAKSWAGAGGLMGLMPTTAATLGLKGDAIFDPEMNIRAGSEYLKKLISTFSEVEDQNERIKLALASYNAGIGHVYDAQALAQKHNADKNVWNANVEKYIDLKRLEQYYKDPVCKFGYFRGNETINYVRNVISRWEAYRSKVK